MAFIKVRTDLFVLPKDAPEEQDKLTSQTLSCPEKVLIKLEFFYYFNCELCSYGTDEKPQLEEHRLVHDNLLQCNICYKNFKYDRSLERHRQQEHFNDVVDVKVKIEEDVNTVSHENLLQCPICKKDFKYERTLEKHRQRYHSSNKVEQKIKQEESIITANNLLQCLICKKDFKWKFTLDIHILKFHSNNGVEQNIKQEEPKRQADKPYQCNICPKSYKYERVLKRHMKVHSEESVDVSGNHVVDDWYPSTATNLDQVFKRAFLYSDEKPHAAKRIKLDESQFYLNSTRLEYLPKCEVSSLKFEPFTQSQSTHFDHQQKRKMSYTCTICFKTYKVKSALERHMKRHSGETGRQTMIHQFFIKPKVDLL